MLNFMKLFERPMWQNLPQSRNGCRNEMSQHKKDGFIEQGRLFRNRYWILISPHIYWPYTRNSKEEYFWMRGFGV